MKLQKLSKNDPVERLSLSIHQSTTQQLELYRLYYEEHYGEAIAQSRLVEEILKAFLQGDKDFQKKLAAKAEAPKAD